MPAEVNQAVPIAFLDQKNGFIYNNKDALSKTREKLQILGANPLQEMNGVPKWNKTWVLFVMNSPKFFLMW